MFGSKNFVFFMQKISHFYPLSGAWLLVLLAACNPPGSGGKTPVTEEHPLPPRCAGIKRTKTPADKAALEKELFTDNPGRNDYNYIDTSQVKRMNYLFHDKINFNADIGCWDTSNVQVMNGLFSGATSFNQDISGWNTSNVRNMAFMFQRAKSFKQNIGAWNVSNVTDMNGMFENATSFNQDIGEWKTASVQSMWKMFKGATAFNQNLSGWNVSQVIDRNNIFDDSPMATRTTQHPKWKQ
ncbi:MAG: BspA family leucine-rich repeat surface protein [Spirochaetota bacterium]